MSEATTGVPAANASVSTIPNDSPPSDGAQSTCAASSAARFSASPTRPSARIPSGSSSIGASSSDSTPTMVSSAGTWRRSASKARSSTGQALALDGLADERDPQRLAGRAQPRARNPLAPPSGSATPLGMTV